MLLMLLFLSTTSFCLYVKMKMVLSCVWEFIIIVMNCSIITKLYIACKILYNFTCNIIYKSIFSCL